MKPIVQLESVSKAFTKVRRLREIACFQKPQQVHALGPLDLTIEAGERIALMGANGSGKSTLLRLLLGILLPSQGKVEVLGTPSNQLTNAVFPHTAMVWGREYTFVFQLTVRENLRFFSGLHGLSFTNITHAIEHFANELHLTDKLDQRYFDLSTGQKQRVGILRALLLSPQLLLLDEATRSLDPKLTQDIWAFLKTYLHTGSKTLVFATHRIEEAMALGTRVLLLAQGHIVFDGTPKDLEQDHSLLLRASSDKLGNQAA